MHRLRESAPLLAWLLALAALVVFPVVAFAHTDSCHRLKTCPDDIEPPKYKCGDNTRRICNEANLPDDELDESAEELSGPPTFDDCDGDPEFYTDRVCAAVLAQAAAASPQAVAATPQPAPATPAPAPLPKNGADEALMALAGGTLVEFGYGLMMLSEGIKRKRRGPVYLQPTLF